MDILTPVSRLQAPSDPASSPQQPPILVVDDNAANRDMLARRLARQGHEVIVAADGYQALEMLRTRAFSLVLLDISMPRMDGYEVLQQIKSDQVLRHVPVVMVTAIDDTESTAKCIEMGAEDYLPKPFNPHLLRARVNACLARKQLHDREMDFQQRLQEHTLRLEERVADQIKELSASQLAAIFAMSKLAESKDPETGAHLERMREYCKVLSDTLARRAPFAPIIDDHFIETIYAASPLHDIGKVGIPDSILLKPGALTAQERATMETHTTLGADTLRAVHEHHPGNDFIRMGIDIAHGHHEKWDGSGYPLGMKGEEIPLSARILALGDVYDALTSKRCYKEAFSHEKSRAIIVEGRGSHFDLAIVDVFLESEEEFFRIRKYFQDPDN